MIEFVEDTIAVARKDAFSASFSCLVDQAAITPGQRTGPTDSRTSDRSQAPCATPSPATPGCRHPRPPECLPALLSSWVRPMIMRIVEGSPTLPCLSGKPVTIPGRTVKDKPLTIGFPPYAFVTQLTSIMTFSPLNDQRSRHPSMTWSSRAGLPSGTQRRMTQVTCSYPGTVRAGEPRAKNS